jgi:hypothetical protein
MGVGQILLGDPAGNPVELFEAPQKQEQHPQHRRHRGLLLQSCRLIKPNSNNFARTATSYLRAVA